MKSLLKIDVRFFAKSCFKARVQLIFVESVLIKASSIFSRWILSKFPCAALNWAASALDLIGNRFWRDCDLVRYLLKDSFTINDIS
jgi:hypothetical protein